MEGEIGLSVDYTSEGGAGSTKKPPPAIFQHSPATGPQPTPTATGQKLLQVKHESRGGGAEKKLGVCWRENSRGHELPAVVFRAALMELAPGVKSAKRSILDRITRLISGVVYTSFMNHCSWAYFSHNKTSTK